MPHPPTERRVLLLGSTGSIGTQTLDVIEHLNALADTGRWPTRYRVVGLAAGANGALLETQARRCSTSNLALADPENRADLTALRGPDAAEQLVRETDADIVLAAVVGAAGLPATLAAAELGRDIALANKETLVAAGPLVTDACRASGARLLPVDSEHAALWQALLAAPDRDGHTARETDPPFSRTPTGVARVTLTASGGPFRTTPADALASVTPAQALDHPTWDMGPKVTIDCASLTNKALEVIEAHHLFNLPPSMIRVLVHPQSIVHALAEFDDGSVLAQLGPTDMRSPIQYALTHPDRAGPLLPTLDLAGSGPLEFQEPDLDRFPALGLAWSVMEAGGTAGAVFNGANEAAVEAFLEGAIPFPRIAELASSALDATPVRPLESLADALDADGAARDHVRTNV